MGSVKNHWDKIYATRKHNELSWTQTVPQTSLEFIHSFHLPKTAAIIDVGGGNSKLAGCLLEEGYDNITVLDISETALRNSKEKLGNRQDKIKWIVSDITEFKPTVEYDVWHDRATFHFLKTEEQIQKYLLVAGKATKQFLTIATFSNEGPEKCSGLAVHRYSEDELENQLDQYFDKIQCITENHETPFHTMQNFLFCSFKKKDQIK